MTSPESVPQTSKFINFGILGLLLIVFGLGVPSSVSYQAQLEQYKQAKRANPDAELPEPAPPGLMVLAIALGTLLPASVALGVGLLAAASAVQNRSHATGEGNFSSFAPDVERSFVPHEKRMLAERSHAGRVAVAGAGAVLALAMGVYFVCYTPCSKFCEHTPASCKNSDQAATWRQSCESSCGSLRAQRGNEFVETLVGCAAAGSTSKQCAEPTEAALSVGLLCKEAK